MSESLQQLPLPQGYIQHKDHIERPDGTFTPLHIYLREINYITECKNRSKKKNKFVLLPHEVSMSNAILRSALFGIVPRGKRTYCKFEKIASWTGTEVMYTGQKLDQSDLDVWAMLIRIAGSNLDKEPCRVRFYRSGFLKSLQRIKGKATYAWLEESLDRLYIGSVRVTDGRYRYDGHLIKDRWTDENTGEEVVELNVKLAQIFCPKVLTIINFDERLALPTDLSKWLHGHLSSHSGEYFCRLSKMRDLCGSTTGMLKKFRQQVAAALDHLCGKGNIIRRYEIKTIRGEHDYLVKIELTIRRRGWIAGTT